MMQQAQQMMGNPAMQQQFQNQMKNMSADDLKRNIDQAQSQLPAASAALPAAPANCAVQQLHSLHRKATHSKC